MQKKKRDRGIFPFPREIPYYCFKEFIALDADRFTMLKTLFDNLHLCYTVCHVNGNRHFFVYPKGLIPVKGKFSVKDRSSELVFQKALAKASIATVLAAHYDRAAGSPGANDNSAGVFELIKTALALKMDNIGNWLIIFTDKEELKFGDSLVEQGSYTLAKALKDSGLEKAQVFIFDCCGIGDTLVISTAVDHMLKKDECLRFSRSRHLIAQMRERALTTARNIRMEKVVLVPTPFSDDAGFFRAGIAAQTITVLPSHEAAELVSVLRVKPEFAAALVSKQEATASGFLPPTWAILNTAEDTMDKLTPRFFQNIVTFAYTLITG
ncbi:MAG: M28 family peptidase [Treponema sp.]|nr:M28 family peptidase [Treponema sp.]